MWKKYNFVTLTKILTGIHFLLLFLTIAVLILLFNNIKFIGTYSNSIIAIAFIISGILVFGLTKNDLVKVYSGIIFGLNVIFQIALFFAPNTLLFYYAIAFVIFQPPYMTKNIAQEKNIEFYDAFLGPPPIYLTEKKFYIFKSQKLMTFKNGNVYSNPKIKLEQTNVDSVIACCIIIKKDSCIKDTLIFK